MSIESATSRLTLSSQDTCTATCDCRLAGNNCRRRDYEVEQALRDEVRDKVADLLRVVDENLRYLRWMSPEGDTVADAQAAILAFAEELGYNPELARTRNKVMVDPPRRTLADRAIAKAFRRIGERDGFRCRICGADRHLTVDHVIAVANGGGDEDENLQLLCKSCNSRKGTR